MKQEVFLPVVLPSYLNEFFQLLAQSPILRKLFLLIVENYLLVRTKDSLFFSEKLSTFTANHPVSVFLQVECHFQERDFVKANYLLEKYSLWDLDENFLILSAKSLIESKNHELVLQKLSKPVRFPTENPSLEGEVVSLRGICNRMLEK